MPQVSIVLPTHNRAHFIGEAIQSVIDQSFNDWELIIVDDGSADNTEEVVRRYQDPRIRYVRQENKGVSVARNRGMSESRSPFIAFLDSDDLWTPDKLERQTQFFLEHPETGLLYGQIERHYMDTGARVIHPSHVSYSFTELLNGPDSIYTPNSVILKRECIETVGMFDVNLHIGEDYDLWLRIAKYYRIAYLPGVVAIVRIHPHNSSRDLKRLYHGYLQMRLKILHSYEDEMTADAHRRYENLVARYRFLLGALYLKRGAPKQATSMIKRALQQKPALGNLLANEGDTWNRRIWLWFKPYMVLALSYMEAATNFLFPSRKSSKDKVRIVIAESGSGYGGSAKYLASLLPYLDKNRYHVEVVACENGPFIKEVESAGYKVYYKALWRFPWSQKWEDKAPKIVRYFFYFVSFFIQIPILMPEIWLWLRKRGIKLIHLNNEIHSHLPLLLAGRWAGCRIVCHLHGWREFTKTERWAVQYVDELISVTEAGAKYFGKQLGGHPVVAIQNGLIYNGQLANFDEKRLEHRRALNIPAEEIAVSILGRLVPWKGHEIFLKALAAAVKLNPAITGIIVGRDPDPYQEYLLKLKRLAEDLRIGDRVRFVSWQTDVWGLYAASDIVVHASVEPEPFGYVILEAMAARRPVIATKGGGVGDLVQDGETGLLVAPSQAEALAQMIVKLSRDANLSKLLAERGEARAKTIFTAERNASQVAKLYESVLNHGD